MGPEPMGVFLWFSGSAPAKDKEAFMKTPVAASLLEPIGTVPPAKKLSVPPRNAPERESSETFMAALLADAVRGAEDYVQSYSAGRGAE